MYFISSLFAVLLIICVCDGRGIDRVVIRPLDEFKDRGSVDQSREGQTQFQTPGIDVGVVVSKDKDGTVQNKEHTTLDEKVRDIQNSDTLVPRSTELPRQSTSKRSTKLPPPTKMPKSTKMSHSTKIQPTTTKMQLSTKLPQPSTILTVTTKSPRLLVPRSRGSRRRSNISRLIRPLNAVVGTTSTTMSTSTSTTTKSTTTTTATPAPTTLSLCKMLKLQGLPVPPTCRKNIGDWS